MQSFFIPFAELGALLWGRCWPTNVEELEKDCKEEAHVVDTCALEPDQHTSY